MPFRKMKQKKFKGIYEYYRTSDHDKTTISYYVSVRNTQGKPVKVKVNATTAEEAVMELARYKHLRKSEPVSVGNRNKSLNEVAIEFFTGRTTANNHKDERRYTLHIKPCLGSIKVAKIDATSLEHLQDYLMELRVPASSKENAPLIGLSNKSINNSTDLAYNIMQSAFKKKYTRPVDVKIDKLSIDNARQRVFSREELDTIFASTEGETKVFLSLMYYTAQRPESILNLQKKHIINGDIVIEAIKKQSTHTVPISPKLAEVLIPWVEGLKPNDYIVTKDSKPMPYQTISGRVSKLFRTLFNQDLDYKQDSKIWSSMYTLRHTSLTNIYVSTGDIKMAQTIANHSSSRMTERYTKTGDSQKVNAVGGL